MNIMSLVYIVMLVFSIVLHEMAHGYAADWLGDPTARLKGRLSLNPLVHIDWLGSVILPLFLVLSGSPFLLGWAKPVPFNPNNMTNRRWGGALVAVAGPITNIIIAILGALVLQFITLGAGGVMFITSLVITNIALAVFNMVPIPPLDGHHILFALIPERFNELKSTLRQYSFVILIIFVIFGWRLIEPVIFSVVNLLI